MNWSTSAVRAVLAITIVVGSFIVCASLVVLPMLGGLQNAKDFAAALKDFGALFSGIIGTVIGFYFGRSGER